MIRIRRNRPDRLTAERLLGGDPGEYPLADRRVARLLAAAAAPARAEELAGEDAARLAFRAAAVVAASTRPRFGARLARGATVKVLAAAVGVIGLGGVAMAATTGSLPAPIQDVAHDAFGAPPPRRTAGPAAGRPQSQPTATSAAPAPSLHGLCRAYTAKPQGERGNALESPAFAALVTAAGGRDEVDEFCTTLLAGPPEGATSAPPSGPGAQSTTGPSQGEGKKIKAKEPRPPRPSHPPAHP